MINSYNKRGKIWQLQKVLSRNQFFTIKETVLVIRILELLNEQMGQLYHTNLINNAYNHHDFSHVPVPAFSFQEPDDEAGLVEISAIPPLSSWSFGNITTTWNTLV